MMYGWFVLLGFASSILSSVFGFGSAMIILAIGPYLLPVHQVIALSSVLFFTSTLTKTIAFRSHLHWPIVGYITVGSLPFAYLGGLLVPHMSQQLLQRCLGVLILGYVCLKHPVVKKYLQVLKKKSNSDTAHPAGAKRRIAGLIAIAATYGFTSGVVGSGSVIKAIFFRQSGLAKEAFVGTMAATSVVATSGKILAYKQTGLLHGALILPILALVVAAITAVLTGRVFLQKIDSQVFNRGVTLLLTVAALGLIW